MKIISLTSNFHWSLPPHTFIISIFYPFIYWIRLQPHDFVNYLVPATSYFPQWTNLDQLYFKDSHGADIFPTFCDRHEIMLWIFILCKFLFTFFSPGSVLPSSLLWVCGKKEGKWKERKEGNKELSWSFIYLSYKIRQNLLFMKLYC